MRMCMCCSLDKKDHSSSALFVSRFGLEGYSWKGRLRWPFAKKVESIVTTNFSNQSGSMKVFAMFLSVTHHTVRKLFFS